jgi:hypothetical protein
MDKPYLLTFQDSKRGYGTFAWFETEEKMNKFIESKSDINVLEAYKINDAEEIF